MSNVDAMSFGHSSVGIQQLCLELASVIHANFHVAATVGPQRQSMSLYCEFEAHYESIINTKAIELAVNLRALFDRCAAFSNPRPLPQATRPSTAIKFTQGNGYPTLRECANKIIHASHFRYRHGRYETTDIGGSRFANEVQESTVDISGWLGKEKWQCELDLLRFAEEAHQAATELQAQYGE